MIVNNYELAEPSEMDWFDPDDKGSNNYGTFQSLNYNLDIHRDPILDQNKVHFEDKRYIHA